MKKYFLRDKFKYMFLQKHHFNKKKFNFTKASYSRKFFNCTIEENYNKILYCTYSRNYNKKNKLTVRIQERYSGSRITKKEKSR